jgi:hypothetical protein
MANFRAIRYLLFSLSAYAVNHNGSRDAAAPTKRTNRTKAVIEDPIWTQNGKSGVIEGDFMFGRKYDAQMRTNVVKDDAVGAPASFAVVAQKKTAAAPKTRSDIT